MVFSTSLHHAQDQPKVTILAFPFSPIFSFSFQKRVLYFDIPSSKIIDTFSRPTICSLMMILSLKFIFDLRIKKETQNVRFLAAVLYSVYINNDNTRPVL